MNARKKLFGTDGVRAVAGAYPLDPPTIARLGTALVALLERKGQGGRILVGRDTRESGPWMERALARGVRAAGGDVVSAGVIPTSAVSYLTKTHGFAAGTVISASHNPFQDNGIKIFSPLGVKIPDEWELEIEADVLEGRGRLPGHETGVECDARLAGDYAGYLAGRVRMPKPPAGIKVVVDCANGASSAVAPACPAKYGQRRSQKSPIASSARSSSSSVSAGRSIGSASRTSSATSSSIASNSACGSCSSAAMS